MMRLVYGRRGWFYLIEFLTGSAEWGTGRVIPDEFGCIRRRWLIGPFGTAKEACVCSTASERFKRVPA